MAGKKCVADVNGKPCGKPASFLDAKRTQAVGYPPQYICVHCFKREYPDEYEQYREEQQRERDAKAYYGTKRR